MGLMFLSLKAIKAQLGICEEDTDQDFMLLGKGEAAESMVLNLINRTAEECVDLWGTSLEGAAPLREAMLAVVGQLYKYREGSTPDVVNEVPFGMRALISPYVRLT